MARAPQALALAAKTKARNAGDSLILVSKPAAPSSDGSAVQVSKSVQKLPLGRSGTYGVSARTPARFCYCAGSPDEVADILGAPPASWRAIAHMESVWTRPGAKAGSASRGNGLRRMGRKAMAG